MTEHHENKDFLDWSIPTERAPQIEERIGSENEPISVDLSENVKIDE